jgi:hypothetical protein
MAEIVNRGVAFPVRKLYRWTTRSASVRRGCCLLFNVSDIAVTLTNIERLPGEDDGEEEADEQ